MGDIWVVVAQQGQARLFHREKRFSPLRELDTLVQPEARLHAQDLQSDRPGRAMNRARGGRTALESSSDPKRVEAEAFARRLAERLHEGRTAGDYQKLILVAGPAFLGLLREALDAETRRCVMKEVRKTLHEASPAEIQATVDAED
ncbi:host attachment protein [Methylonatrum kenyense]|uniref:host attachment protein n=1 Tax=Methylonatrum kenyense TaxID=455253 RepID=UPI0020BEFCBC|nr:host attachment protein [Methylonatrum kenyense]